MTTATRTNCPACGRPTATINGRLARHHADGEWCQTVAAVNVLIPLNWVRPPLRSNDRRHWKAQWRAFQEALAECKWAIRDANPPRIAGCEEAILHWRVPNRRVQDSDGIAPSIKPALDALVQEGILPADDWVSVPKTSQQIHPPLPGMPPATWLELRSVTHYMEGVA